jgi:hypothetical protein
MAHPLYEKTIGRKLYAGTINVLAPDPGGGHRIISQAINPPALQSRTILDFCPCSLDGHAAFILSTWHPGATYTPHQVDHLGHTLFEVIAEHAIPGIAYDVKVALEFDPANLQWARVRT